MHEPADPTFDAAVHRSPSGLAAGARPSVSVLLPCRNVAPYLPACLKSLSEQTLRDFEVVAVDDGSNDGTAEILRAWAARDPRVRLTGTRRDGNRGRPDPGGIVAALDVAVRFARAPLLARMDGDDVAHPSRLELQARFLGKNPGLAACGTRVELFPAARVGGGYARYADWLNGLTNSADLMRDLFVECPIAHPTLMIRSSALLGLGGYRDAGWPEDYDLVLRLFAAGLYAANLPEVLLRWRVRPDRHSLDCGRYSAAAFRRCKVHFLLTRFLPLDRSLVVWGAGRVGKALTRELLSQGVEVDAFVDLDPRKIGREIHGAPVLDPRAFADLVDARRPYVLVAVGSPGARDEIRQALNGLGRCEIDDYRVCA